MEKIFDSELKVMQIIWEFEPVCAKEISIRAEELYGWNKNTTYTVIGKLIGKKAIKRTDPDYICTSLIRKDEVQNAETKSLIEKLFDGSKKAFFSAFIEAGVSEEELEEMKKLIEKR